MAVQLLLLISALVPIITIAAPVPHTAPARSRATARWTTPPARNRATARARAWTTPPAPMFRRRTGPIFRPAAAAPLPMATRCGGYRGGTSDLEVHPL